jgi:hypothetical protein
LDVVDKQLEPEHNAISPMYVALTPFDLLNSQTLESKTAKFEKAAA